MKAQEPLQVITEVAGEALTAKRLVDYSNKHTAGAISKGVNLFDTDSGDLASIATYGILALEVAAAVSAGTWLQSDADGKGVVVSSGACSAIALDEATAAGDIIRVKL